MQVLLKPKNIRLDRLSDSHDSRADKAAPFNITIIQVYAQTSGYDDNEINHFYYQFQETIAQTPKKDILVGLLKSRRMRRQAGETFVDPTAVSRQMRDLSDSMVCNL